MGKLPTYVEVMSATDDVTGEVSAAIIRDNHPSDNWDIEPLNPNEVEYDAFDLVYEHDLVREEEFYK